MKEARQKMPDTVRFHLYEMDKIEKSIQVAVVVARDLGMKAVGVTANGYQCSFGDDNILELRCW